MVGVTTTCPELGHIRATLLPHIDHTLWWKCGGTESIGVVVALKHYLKDDVRDLIDRWITVFRNDQAFHNCGYRIVSVIHLDNATSCSQNQSKSAGNFLHRAAAATTSCSQNQSKSAENPSLCCHQHATKIRVAELSLLLSLLHHLQYSVLLPPPRSCIYQNRWKYCCCHSAAPQ